METQTVQTEVTPELVQLVESSGLAVEKKNQIAETLGVFFNKASEWDKTIASIVITSPDETGKMRMAKEGRLTLKGMRLDAEKIVKAKRDEVKYLMNNFVLEDKLWLKAGQMMEATFKNLETKLEEKEKFAERWEAKQREILKEKRIAELLPLGFVLENGFDLGSMSEEMFLSLKSGLETQKREKEEAEAKRIEQERAEAAERERIRLENERLKAEALEKEKQMQAEREQAEKERKAIEEKAAKEKAEAEQKALAEKKAIEEVARKEREASEAKIKAEREEKERLLAEIQAKKESDERARKEEEKRVSDELKAKQKAEAKAAKAPKKEKLTIWVDGLTATPPVGMIEDETVVEILAKFEAFKKWAKSQIEIL